QCLASPALASSLPMTLFLCCSRSCRLLPSFPTRRSSDLTADGLDRGLVHTQLLDPGQGPDVALGVGAHGAVLGVLLKDGLQVGQDRKSTRLNSSHVSISYAVFCLRKKKESFHRLTKPH